MNTKTETKTEQETEKFDDHWFCQMCRTAERTCAFHLTMEADGYEPPKSFAGLI